MNDIREEAEQLKRFLAEQEAKNNESPEGVIDPEQLEENQGKYGQSRRGAANTRTFETATDAADFKRARY